MSFLQDKNVNTFANLFKGRADVYALRWEKGTKSCGKFKVLIATGQLFGEGLDVQGFDVLVLAFPISFEGKLKQYIGRLRGDGIKYIVDIGDTQIAFLERQFKKRQKLYKNEFCFNASL